MVGLDHSIYHWKSEQRMSHIRLSHDTNMKELGLGEDSVANLWLTTEGPRNLLICLRLGAVTG